MSGISALQGGQADLELESADAAVLLAPYVGTTPLLNLENALAGGLDLAKIGPTSPFQTVGNWTKDEGVTLTNSPTIVDIESHGKGSPTKKLASRAPKGIRYTPQETNLLNLQNYWGFPLSAVEGPSAFGGIVIGIPELPVQLLWRCVLLSYASYNGQDIIKYWIANRASVGERQDAQMTDSNVDRLGVSLSFETDPAVPGQPVRFGILGAGWQQIGTTNKTGFNFASAPLTGVTVTPPTAAIDVSDATTQQLTVVDSNGQNRTATAAYGTTDDAVATVTATGLIVPAGAGTAEVTAAYGGHTDSCIVTVTA